MKACRRSLPFAHGIAQGPMARKPSFVKVVVGLAVVAVVALLFVRSVRNTRAEPFAVRRESLAGWTLVMQPPDDPLSSWLALSPPPQLPTSLGREIFARGGESVNYPSPSRVPLLLRSEFDRAFAGTVAPEDIVSLARAAGFESMEWKPHCMAHRRISEPGGTRGLHFVLLEAPSFDSFRQQLSELLRGSARDLFDPLALSPVLIVAGLDGNFGRWMPLRADPEADCLAPVHAER